jgi:bicarbonate transport system substrate-binding protein
MSDFDNNFSRRKFLATAGASAVGAALTSYSVSSVNAQAGKPEVTKVKLGYLPIVEAAPLIIAKEKGFFAKHGMTDVEVSKQANWGAARDNVKIGSSAGGIDGGQWQMPMPYLISEGIITGNEKIPMYVLLQLNTQGNGIAIAGKHKGQGVGLRAKKAFFDKMKSGGTKFKAAYTFPKANQELWIRYWLAANGVNPDTDIELITVPAAQTVANMKSGTMDAFSTGDPWPYKIVNDKIGFIAALTAEIWKAHPEEYLAIRADWVDKNPKATVALLKGVMEAQRWCDNFSNRKELVNILSGRNYFGVPTENLEGAMMGDYDMGDGRKIDDKNMAVLYWKDSRGSVSYPYQSHDLWFLTESVRWGFLPKDTLAKANGMIKKVNREDLWRQAAKELNIPKADIPASTSRGVETFFDGVKFDPKNPQAYLNGLKIKNV